MSATGVDQFSASITGFLADVANRAAQAVSPAPGRILQLAPGELAAHDDCCEGQVWSRLVNLGPLPSNNPAQRPGLGACAAPEFILTAELGVVRCAAVVNDRGHAPSPRQITQDGVQGINDMAELLGVLRCTEGLRELMPWTPTGPEGGCHGGYWTYNIRVSNCLGCEDEEG